MNNKIDIDRYIMYGLNRRRNFISLPRGNRISLSTHEDILRFAKKSLKGKLCESALFFVYLDGTYSSIFKKIFSEEHEDSVIEEEDLLKITFSICETAKRTDRHLFAELDGDFRFCCYSLLLEVENGVFEVCK